MKKTALVVIACVLLLSVAVLCLCILPDYFKTNDTSQASKPDMDSNVIGSDVGSVTKINASMHATKLDKDGNAIGTDKILLQGSFKDYLFEKDRLELSINPFGTLKNIILSNDECGNTYTVPVPFEYFYTFTFMAWDTSKEDSVFCTVTVSQDFEYWVFRVGDNDQPTYYVASASNEHTLEEIVQYFKGIAPGYKAP